MQGYIVSSEMGGEVFPNVGLRYDRLQTMQSIIEGLFLTMDAVTVRAGEYEVRGTSYREIEVAFGKEINRTHDRALAAWYGVPVNAVSENPFLKDIQRN